MDNLFYLHILAFIVHSISTGLSFGYDQEVFQNREIWYPKFKYNSSDVGITTEVERIVVAEKQNYMAWIFYNELLTAVSHLIAVIYLTPSFLKEKDNEYVDLDKIHKTELFRRTVEYSFTAAIIQIALVLGAGDVLFQDVVFIFVINICIQILGYNTEKEGEQTTSLFLVAFLLLIGELVYVYTLSTTINFGPGPLENQTTYLTLTGIFYVVFYVSFGTTKLYGNYAKVDKIVEDKVYVVLSITTKICLSWLLIGNIFSGFYNLCEYKTNSMCDDIKISAWYGDWVSPQITLICLGCFGLIISTYLMNRSAGSENDGYTEVEVNDNRRRESNSGSNSGVYLYKESTKIVF